MTTAAAQPLPGPGVTFRDQVAAEVRAHLARRSMSGRNLAKLIDRDQTWVSRRLKGTIPMTTDDLDLIAGALGMTAIELLVTIPPTGGPSNGPGNMDVSAACVGSAETLAQVIPFAPPGRAVAAGNGSPATWPGYESAGITLKGGVRTEHHASAA